jgi:hypothetical protein
VTRGRHGPSRDGPARIRPESIKNHLSHVDPFPIISGPGADMSEPSVKGTLFQNLANELAERVSDGTISASQLASRLEPDELERLDHEIAISSWYPLDLYCRMLEVYALGASGAQGDFLMDSGRRSAQRVIDLGIYSQLDDRTEESWENRVGRILVTLSGSFFNFGKWEWSGLEGDGYSIRVRDAAPMSDLLVWRTAGFIELLTQRAAGAPVALGHERIAGGRDLIFRARRI